MKDVAWKVVAYFLTLHVVSVVAIHHISHHGFTLWQIAAFLFFWITCGLGVTAGYHRLFSHGAYKAAKVVQLTLAIWGSGAFQNSILVWANKHRLHHAHTDGTEDPYSIERGFFYAHMGWVMMRGKETVLKMGDLRANPIVCWQSRHWLLIGVGYNIICLLAFGWLSGDYIGMVLVAGVLRITFLHHVTFSINSFAHWRGSRKADPKSSAVDSLPLAVLTMGEGYHSSHHAHPSDYRNGQQWWQWDPTKWFIAALSWLGLAWDLKK